MTDTSDVCSLLPLAHKDVMDTNPYGSRSECVESDGGLETVLAVLGLMGVGAVPVWFTAQEF